MPSSEEGELNERSGSCDGVGEITEHRGNRHALDFVAEAITAQQESIPSGEGEFEDIDRNLGFNTERSGEHVPLRMHGCLGRRELAVAHHLSSDRVVVGDEPEFAVRVEVAP